MHRRLVVACGVAVLCALSLGVSAAARTAVVGAVYLPLVRTTNGSVTPTPEPQNPLHAGEGTYYGADGTGNCGFAASPGDLMVAAMNHVDYAGSALCGAFVDVTGPRGTVRVRITDQCPECAAGDVDLSQQAFAVIADPVAGRVPITWRIVSPALSGPIAYYIQPGSNAFYLAVQIRNHRNPISKVEYLAPGGSFVALPRADYNFFILSSGVGPAPYTFRVTDIYGNVLTDSGIPLTPGVDIPGGAQFPKGP